MAKKADTTKGQDIAVRVLLPDDERARAAALEDYKSRLKGGARC